jgi:hypothetical protein
MYIGSWQSYLKGCIYTKDEGFGPWIGKPVIAGKQGLVGAYLRVISRIRRPGLEVGAGEKEPNRIDPYLF